MGKIAYTFSVMRSSWEVLKKDRELLLFPIFSAICCLLVLASFAFPLIATHQGQPDPIVAGERPLSLEVWHYVLMFAYYFCNYFVIIFFNSAVVACAVVRLRGGDPTVATGFRASFSRLPHILGWALVSASVGMILRIIESRSRRVGRIVAAILGMAWSVLTFLVIPILVVERKGPIEAFKESAVLLKKTWGEQIIGNFCFGLIFFLIGLGAIIPFGLAFVAPGMVLKLLLVTLGIIYLIILGLVQSTLQTIFQAAVYLYARDGRAPEGFDETALGSAMGSRG